MPIGVQDRDSALKVADLGMTLFYDKEIETVLTKLFRRGDKLRQDVTTWPLRKRGVVATEAVMDKADKTTFGGTSDSKAQMYLERVWSPGYHVGRIAQGQEMAAIADNLADEIKRDRQDLAVSIENLLGSDQECQLESGAATPYKTRGIFKYLQTAAQGTLPIADGFRPSSACNFSGTIATYFPESLEAQLQQIAIDTQARPNLVFVAGPILRSRVSKWPYHATADDNSRGVTFAYQSSLGKKMAMVVEEMEFTHGKVNVVTSHSLLRDLATGATSAAGSRSGALIDPTSWRLRWMDEPSWWEVANAGGGPRGFHDAILMLVCYRPIGQGIVSISADS